MCDEFEVVDDDEGSANSEVASKCSVTGSLTSCERLEYEIVDDDVCEQFSPAPAASAVLQSSATVPSVQTGVVVQETPSAGPAVAPMAYCDHCGLLAPPKRCSRCHDAVYCSVACQRTAWTAGHKLLCTAAASKAAPLLRNPPAAASAVRSPAFNTAEPMHNFASDSNKHRVARLREEVSSWQLPASRESARFRTVALLHVERTLPTLLDAHAAYASQEVWSEHHTSGLLDRKDSELPARSPELISRLSERLLHVALGECLEDAGRLPEACGAFGRSALASAGWVEVYHRWHECLKLLGCTADCACVCEIAVAQGVWQNTMQRPNERPLCASTLRQAILGNG